MAEELKKCPFCGSDVSFWKYSDGIKAMARSSGIATAPMVGCPSCKAMVSFNTNYASVLESEAAAAWNRRVDKTCCDFGGKDGTNGEDYDFACSACGFCCDLPDIDYCPNCGSRVVERDR